MSQNLEKKEFTDLYERSDQQLGEQGYCIIPEVFSDQQVSKALKLLLSCKEQADAFVSEEIPRLNQNQDMMYNLQNKHPYFLELLFYSDLIEQLLMRYLNDEWYKAIAESQPNYILRSYLARSSSAAMPLHIDSFIPYCGDRSVVMQCVIVLEDMRESNGWTLVVPGSHQSGRYAEQSSRPEAVGIAAPAGSVVLWDSRLWHGAEANTGSGSRWALIATFSRWWVKQAFDIPQSLPEEIYVGLSDKQKAVLGYCSVPFEDESQGIDFRRGYNVLRN